MCPIATTGADAGHDFMAEKRRKRQAILDNNLINVWQKKHMLDELDKEYAKYETAAPAQPAAPAKKADAGNPPQANPGKKKAPTPTPSPTIGPKAGPAPTPTPTPPPEPKKETPAPRKAEIKNPFTYLNLKLGDPKQPGSVGWLVSKGVPLEAAQAMQPPYTPKPVTIDDLVHKDIPWQAARAILEPATEPQISRAQRIQMLVNQGVPIESARAMTSPALPRQPEVKPGSVDWLMQRNVPLEAAKAIADPGPSKFDPQEGTPEWLVKHGVPRESAKVIGREPDPIQPDDDYWQRKKEILENPEMSPYMKNYLLGLLEDRYHSPMNKAYDPYTPVLTPNKLEVIDATIRQKGRVTQQDMEDLGIGTGMYADFAAENFNIDFYKADEYGISLQEAALQYALSQSDQGAAYTAWKVGDYINSRMDASLPKMPSQKQEPEPEGGNNSGGPKKIYHPRTYTEYEDLARDTDQGGKITAGGINERDVVMKAENTGLLGKVKRAPARQGDYIEINTGKYWDVKSFRSSTPNGKGRGAYNLADSMDNILRTINKGRNILIDTKYLTIEDAGSLKNEVTKRGLGDRVIFVEP